MNKKNLLLSKKTRALLQEIFLGKNKKRFAAFTKILDHLASLIGDPLSIKENRLVDALYHTDSIDQLYASINVDQIPFLYNLLRLSFDEINFLFERIHTFDCYRFRDIKKNAPIVIDIGAHIGIFPRFVFKEEPESSIYAFEPDLENFELLSTNLKPFQKAFIFQQGMLNKKETLNLYTSNKIDWRTTLLVKKDFRTKSDFLPDEYSTSYSVQVTNIDDFISENCLPGLDLLKITAPGEIEHLILEGGKATIEKYRPQISIYVYPVNRNKIESFFNDIGGYSQLPCPYKKSSNIKIFHSK